MKKLAIAAAIALLVAGCAHKTGEMMYPQVNRAAKADKYAAPKKAAPVEKPTPNSVVKSRFCDGFMARWCSRQ
jgi:putative hemolysin